MHVEPSQNAVEELIQTSPVVFFSKSYCPFCVRVKELFEDMDIKPLTIELDDLGKSRRLSRRDLETSPSLRLH
ncbi:hypothetical protein DYB25_002428 [Aphanomyces astaci]|uniref:Glutaredoxin domain-containing protein n=1 Tax=Aphanomyces astaci TaxID=112090 RepID=A0A397DFR3_APHAT|nr:hypothetical protein DYB25_002428 [Aphanomyces astaci]RHY61321.1 hypothetical protein DYB30_002158 [Aphanomyces astaci]RHY69007.1 hypothetical protein DYB34_002902 [Aphanomyces astaci]RHY71718.1 hypothetical protein DYB38_003241 [Aphanomyces astaci]RHY85176.1 hypothetical protein DYB26_001560 [Aphanomyces astaci]